MAVAARLIMTQPQQFQSITPTASVGQNQSPRLEQMEGAGRNLSSLSVGEWQACWGGKELMADASEMSFPTEASCFCFQEWGGALMDRKSVL